MMQIKLLEATGHMDGGALWASDGQRLFREEPTPDELFVAADEEGYLHYDGRSSPLPGTLDGRLAIVLGSGWRDATTDDQVDGLDVIIHKLRSEDETEWSHALCVEEE